MTAAILLLAAGASRRMRGADKLLQPVAGEALLRRQARAALATGVPVAVTLPPGAAGRRGALEGLSLRRVEVADAAEGMGASIRAGVAALPAEASGVLILPGDLPEIEAGDLAVMLARHAQAPGVVLRAAAQDGRPGHPVVFPARLLPALRRLSGDAGARLVLAGEAVVAVALPGERATTDLDTPEAWAEWRANTGL